MNILLIDIDSLRPDHLGCYGYKTGRTPNIDALAAESVIFENAYTASSPSLPSRASLISGRYSVSHGVVSHGPGAQNIESPKTMEPEELREWDGDLEEWSTLPGLFFKNRIKTAAVSSEPRHPAPWINNDWHQFYQPQEPEGGEETHATVRGEDVADIAIDIIEREEGFLLYTQFWDPHIPCNRDADDTREFLGTLPGYLDSTELEFEGWNSPHGIDVESPEDVERIIAGYDAEIAYVDLQVGRLLEKLKIEGLYDDTLIVLSGDHGEEFGENGVYREHWSVYEGTQRIPLLVKPPSGADRQLREELVTNVDIAPTVADYAGLEVPARWQGRSLRPLVDKEKVSWRDSLVVDHGLYTVQRAIIDDAGWKLVRTLHPGARDLPEIQLFNLEDDPYEEQDLSAEFGEEVKRLEEIKERWIERHLTLDRDPILELAEKGPVAYRYFR